ncbi:hypothetical protein Raf01_28960 [Rugosimonospora africana]|uniref:Uncharacterized protein n=1 Tax=Rugosimonospora africana TaxID=556532 RepID=A0A8J3VQ33_9ACTN|nr:hypothetical protein Raf01_28960 [Rugosimonospora africana]
MELDSGIELYCDMDNPSERGERPRLPWPGGDQEIRRPVRWERSPSMAMTPKIGPTSFRAATARPKRYRIVRVPVMLSRSG